eukprot:XP_011683747.1 PREDICTED: uncharacterized protein LOC105447425 isoform X1 [Strongylocentrotus purpuratus]
MMLWSMYRVQCVLTLVITVTLHRSYAELFCNFGERTWSSDAGLNECGITQPSSSPAWGATSGRGYNGNAPSGGANDGFLLTTGGRGNMQIQAMFQLPNPNLQQNSGLLSFHFKFFDPGESILTISVCGLIIDDVNLQSNGNWELVENIRIYCHGYEPTVTFTALWSLSSGRVAVDNIRVVSTSPPTTTTKATTTTTLKSSTSTKQTMNTTGKTMTNLTTSEWTRSSPESTGLSTIEAVGPSVHIAIKIFIPVVIFLVIVAVGILTYQCLKHGES